MKSLGLISAQRLLPKRFDDSHKGSYGRALLIAGSENMTGACILASRACYKTGTGLVEVSAPEGAREVLQVAVPEAIILPYEKLMTDDFLRFRAILIGPGMGISELSVKALEHLLIAVPKEIPLVLDADALNILSTRSDLAEKVRLHGSTVITPHPGEAGRLLGCSAKDITEMGASAAAELAKRFNAVCVLKIHPEVIATPEGTLWKNPTGNNGMATAGSGDVLAGIITGLMAQGLDPEQAAVSGCFWHGYAGDSAARKNGKAGLVASDIVNNIRMDR